MTTPNTPRETSTSGGEAATSGASEAENAATARIIKRYSNRKLYDTVESRYVTLPQIAQLVRKGEDVRIIDNNTKEDLTSVTLAQILYEEERKQSRALPLGALKDLIHTSGEKLISSLREGPMGKFIGGRGAGEGGVEPAAAPSAPIEEAPSPAVAPPVAEAAGPHNRESGPPGRLQGMLEQSRGALEEWQHRVDERVRKVLESLSPSSQVDKLQAEVRRLTQRLEELEARLAARTGKRDEGSE